MNIASCIPVMLLMVFLASCSQVILKKAASRQYASRLAYFANWRTASAYGIFFGTTLVGVYLYRYVSLSLAGAIETAAYVFVPLLDRVVLKTRISRRTLFANALIVVGILLCSYSSL